MARPASDDPAVQEILDRVRRLESRVTALTNKMGFTVPVTKPRWVARDGAAPAKVIVPSPETALDEILAAIPEDYHDTVVVRIGQDKGRLLCLLQN